MEFTKAAEEWFEYKKPFGRVSTLKSYSTLKNTLIRDFKDCDTENIKRSDIQRYINLCGEIYTKKTVISRLKIIRQIFSYVEEQDEDFISPVSKIKIPCCKNPKEVIVSTLSDINKLMKVECPQYKKDLIQIAFRTGMRIGEILTLKWSDVNFEENYLVVHRTLSVYNNGNAIINAPKTPRSHRAIDLDIVTMNILKRIMSEKGISNDFIFTKKNGKIYSRQCIRLYELCDKAGIPRRNFHSLRHTHISYCLSHKVDIITVQSRAGHTDATTTLHYAHVLPGTQLAAAKLMGQIPYSFDVDAA